MEPAATVPPPIVTLLKLTGMVPDLAVLVHTLVPAARSTTATSVQDWGFVLLGMAGLWTIAVLLSAVTYEVAAHTGPGRSSVHFLVPVLRSYPVISDRPLLA